MRHRSEAGDTLIEVLISLVVIGVVVSAFFAGMMTTSRATVSQRNVVTADAVLRDYAEAVKQTVREFCVYNGPEPENNNTGATVTVELEPAPPPGFVVAPVDAIHCPAPTDVGVVHIKATLPNGVEKFLDIAVRTP